MRAASHVCSFAQLTEASYDADNELKAPSLVQWYEEAIGEVPVLLCLDANSRPDQQGVAEDTLTVWKTLRSDPVRGQSTRSVWDSDFGADGSPKRPKMPSTTNKMRGALSTQPKKIGEHT